MTERSMFWDGTVLGDCGPYSTADMHDLMFRSVLNGTGNRGVLLGWLDELGVSGTSTPLTIASGGGVIYGLFYENDDAVSVAVGTPSSGTSRYDRIVVRRDWSAQTARITRVTGTAAISPAIPALTQTAGAIYEIPLATILVDDAGTITITDDREYCSYSTEWPALSIDTVHFASGAVTADKIPDRTRYFIKEAGQLEADTVQVATWVAGASYDFWNFATGADQSVWLYDLVPYTQAGVTLTINLWTVPDAAAAGNVRWDYDYALVLPDNVATFTNGNVVVAQGGRLTTTAYQDAYCTPGAANVGQLFILKITRLGADAADTFGNAMRLLGVEIQFTAQA